MKKLILFLTLLFTFSTTVFADELSTESSIQPRESSVFVEVASRISRSGYGGDCTLTAKGSGTMTICLQKKNSSGNWANVTGTTKSYSFSNTRLAGLSESKTLSSGVYRCKTYVSASANGYFDSRTVYSPTLTLSGSN